MSVGLPSDEVAEDFKSSLEDLVDINRYSIQNLASIAKENVEHASAICRVLETHIKTTVPNRKLPALYLLDSIIKNNGTPYTLFLGRNLYSTFMTAYSLVDGNTRHKMDEMLNTWKRPMPGSLETKPVLPQNVTRPIEDALSKARNAAIEQNYRQASRIQDGAARHLRTPPAIAGYRQTSTPAFGSSIPQSFPNVYSQFAPGTQFPQTNQYPAPLPNAPPPNSMNSPTPAPFQQPRSFHPPPSPIDLPLLHRDIADLVRNAQSEAAADPISPQTQERLQALTALQMVLQQQYHPPEQLQKVREQVTTMQSQYRPSRSVSNLALPTGDSAQLLPTSNAHPIAAYAPVNPRVPSPIDIQALMSSRNLASIIASAQKASPATPVNQMPSSQTQTVNADGASDLIASLTKAGLLSGPTALSFSGASVNSAPASHPALARLVPLTDIQLTSASLKRPRLELVSLLYESQPNQCITCGRRFPLTENGRADKSKHYDWHFRTNQRISTSSKRAQNRSWYVDELEWIKSRDDPEGNLAAAGIEHQEMATSSQSSKIPFILVPADPNLANQSCPICQEKFVASYNDEVADWVWMDAIEIPDSRSNAIRVYHASCHRELKKTQSRENTPARTDTPDSILGKRKAIEATDELQVKLIRV